MIFREARSSERELLFREGYRVWSRGRTYEQYCAENRKEDQIGKRSVIEVDGIIVCSLIVLRLKAFMGVTTCGIGSVITHEGYTGRGFATELIERCVEAIDRQYALVFLYSDINPKFYERFGFRPLPDFLQKKKSSVCMARCNNGIWDMLVSSTIGEIPKYF